MKHRWLLWLTGKVLRYLHIRDASFYFEDGSGRGWRAEGAPPATYCWRCHTPDDLAKAQQAEIASLLNKAERP